jgi:hypothetical protein
MGRWPWPFSKQMARSDFDDYIGYFSVDSKQIA